MARPRTFDRDAVLTRAMSCFWLRGYTATSLKDLEAATALTPGSLYNSFESKDGLFLAALDHYIEQVVEWRVNHYLRGPYVRPDDTGGSDDPLAGIEDFFHDGVKQRGTHRRRGCLVINTCTEIGPHDETVRKRVQRAIRRVELGLREALGRARAQGLLDASIDVAERARHLGFLFQGMQVHTRVAADNRWLDDAMHTIRALLR